MTGIVIAKLPTAAVRGPTNGAAGSYTFYATWADPAMGAPASLNVVIDGACTAMARELGTDTLNATYKATATLAAGCHNYFVAAHDAAGAALSYPTTGAITISVGSTTACSSDFLATAPAAACVADGGAPPPPPPVDAAVDRGPTTDARNGTGGTPGTGAGGAPGTGAGGAPGTGAGGAPGTGAGGAPGTGAGGAPPVDGGGTVPTDGPTPPVQLVNGGCTCDLRGAGSSPLTGGSLLTIALLLGARRRRRGPTR